MFNADPYRIEAPAVLAVSGGRTSMLMADWWSEQEVWASEYHDDFEIFRSKKQAGARSYAELRAWATNSEALLPHHQRQLFDDDLGVLECTCTD